MGTNYIAFYAGRMMSIKSLLQLEMVGARSSRAAPGRSGPLLLQSCSLRVFLRARLRARAALTRFFSPGFR